MMHPFKRFIVVAAVACMVPAVAFASTSRILGLNIPGDYVKDYTGMFTYLSTVNSAGNLVYGETGSMLGTFLYGDRAMGAVLPNLFDGKAGVWAIHMRHMNPALGQSWIGMPINGGFGSFDPNQDTPTSESFDIMWGHRMSSTNIGLRLHRQFVSFDDGTQTIEGDGNDARNVIGFGGGVGFDVNPNMGVEVGVLYQTRSFDEGDGLGDLTEDGGTAYLLAGRAWMKSGSNLTIVPVVKLWKIDQSVTDGTTPAKDELSGFQAGVAGNWAVGQDDLFVLGANLVSNKEEMDTDEFTETLMPNLFMALESHLNPWLTFRCGAQQSVFATYKDKDTSPGGVTTTLKVSDFSFNMGTSVKLGNVMFDAVLDPAFLHNPFAQLMGNTNAVFEGSDYYQGFRAAGGPAGTPFTHVSLTYTW